MQVGRYTSKSQENQSSSNRGHSLSVLHGLTTTTLDVEAIFEGLPGNTHFFKVDLSNAFHLVLLDDSNSELTTINTIWGLPLLVFPFGLNVSLSKFQAFIDGVIAGLTGVRAYQDDIIVVGSSKTAHDNNLRQLLRSLQQHNVKINVRKSTFGVNKVKYLGYVLDGQSTSPD